MENIETPINKFENLEIYQTLDHLTKGFCFLRSVWNETFLEFILNLIEAWLLKYRKLKVKSLINAKISEIEKILLVQIMKETFKKKSDLAQIRNSEMPIQLQEFN